MSIEDKIKLWTSRLPELEHQNQFYCLYWAEPDLTGRIYTEPSLVKFFKTKASIVKYLLEEEYPFEAEDFPIFFEEDHRSGWNVFIAEAK